MAEYWRATLLLISTAWRVDRKLTLAAVTDPLGNTLALLAGYWLSLTAMGVLRHERALIVVGVAGLVAGAGLAWQLELSSSQWLMVLSDKVAHAFDTELARLSAAIPSMEHHERPEYQDKLELLRQRQGLLGGSLSTLAMTFKAVCAAATVLVLLISVHPLMLTLAVLALPSIYIARTQQRWRSDAEERSATPGRIARHLRALTVDRDAAMEIRVFGLADEIQTRAAQAWDDHRRPLDRAERRIAFVNATQEILFVACSIAAIGFVLWRAIRGRSAPGEVILAVVLSQQVQAAVIWPIQAVAGLGQTLRTVRRYRWLRDYADATMARYAEGRPAPDSLTDGIVFDDVSFRYPGTDTWALRHLSIKIRAGSVVALVGENGTGKTTVVKLLTRMYEPTEGRILVDGVDLTDIDITSWRRRLSAAFQDFARFEFTACHSVGVGDLPRLDDDGHVLGALERAGATNVTSALPDGLGTQLGARWNGQELSTGQWQKVALGRALMRTDPLVVFFDEPTAALDAPTEHALFERYSAAARAGADHGMITVLVSHRFSTVRTADQIVVLADRQVVEHGTHAELIAAGSRYAEMYRLQARSYVAT
jgi:ATP-binding cassette subfamily B protein